MCNRPTIVVERLAAYNQGKYIGSLRFNIVMITVYGLLEGTSVHFLESMQSG